MKDLSVKALSGVSVAPDCALYKASKSTLAVVATAKVSPTILLIVRIIKLSTFTVIAFSTEFLSIDMKPFN